MVSSHVVAYIWPAAMSEKDVYFVSAVGNNISLGTLFLAIAAW